MGDSTGVESAIDQLRQRLMVRLDDHPVIGIQGAGPLADPVHLQRVPPTGGFMEVGQAFGLLEERDPPFENRPAASELSPTLLFLRADALKPSIGP